MKKILTILMSAFVLLSFAQDRVPGPAKPKIPIGERQCSSFVMTPVDGIAVTANTLIENILGADIVSYDLVSFEGTTGINASAGLFAGGIAAGIGIESGIVLSSGFINNAIGPNEFGGVTGELNLPGDAQLTALAGQDTYDATILEFEFVPEFNEIFIKFVFGSDEYTEYIGSINDVFGFFLNGVNIALVPGTTDPVAINTINPGSNSVYYIDNEFYVGDVEWPAFCNEMDGYTTVLQVSGLVNPGEVNTIKLAIADASDDILDSWVFIEAEGFTGVIEPPIPVSNWALYLGILLMITFVVIRFRRMI